MQNWAQGTRIDQYIVKMVCFRYSEHREIGDDLGLIDFTGLKNFQPVAVQLNRRSTADAMYSSLLNQSYRNMANRCDA